MISFAVYVYIFFCPSTAFYFGTYHTLTPSFLLQTLLFIYLHLYRSYSHSLFYFTFLLLPLFRTYSPPFQSYFIYLQFYQSFNSLFSTKLSFNQLVLLLLMNFPLPLINSPECRSHYSYLTYTSSLSFIHLISLFIRYNIYFARLSLPAHYTYHYYPSLITSLLTFLSQNSLAFTPMLMQ